MCLSSLRPSHAEASRWCFLRPNCRRGAIAGRLTHRGATGCRLRLGAGRASRPHYNGGRAALPLCVWGSTPTRLLHPRWARRHPGEQIISLHDQIMGRVAPASAHAFHHCLPAFRCSRAASDVAGQAATTCGVELCGHARCNAAADHARGRAWRHVVGLGWLGAGSMRTRRAAHVCALVWARLWRCVARAPSKHENA